MRHNPEFMPPAEVLPYGNLLRWVDGIIDVEPGVYCHAFWQAPDWIFDGHFGLMMGFVEAEAVAQATVYAYSLALPHPISKLPLLGEVERARFTRTVRKGEILQAEVVIDTCGKPNEFQAFGLARVGDEITFEATFSGRMVSHRVAEKLGAALSSV